MSHDSDALGSSSFSDRSRRRRRQQWQGSDGVQDSDAVDDIHAFDNYSTPHPTAESLLELFRVISHYQIQIFSVEPNQQWNVRQALGHGASFEVEQTGLPVSSTLSHLRYRNLDIREPNEDFNFTDHTGTRWACKQLVAFKSVRKRNDGLFELIKELRIYCHKPIQQHPHIVRLLGIAFYTEQDLDTDVDAASYDPENLNNLALREIPLLVIERAPQASLTAFLKSPEFTKVPASLKAKMRLCTDVLSAIEALHACGILHGDIKCDNVLIFKSETGTGENWRAKVTDFGHSEIDAGPGHSAPSRPSYRGGTKYYDAPEVILKTATLELLHKVDIWCWGLLLWQVVVNGAEFDPHEEDWRDGSQMQQLKEQDRVLATAKSRCEDFMNKNHRDEINIFPSIIEALNDTLCRDPQERRSADSIVTELKNAIEDFSNFNLRPSQLEFTASFSQFDITRLYYDLKGLVTMPRRIYEELDQTRRELQGEPHLHATYQMGLCQVVGFGHQENFGNAVELIMEAADGGHEEAQAIIFRLSKALGINLDPDTQEAINRHLKLAAHRNSRIAMQDLRSSGQSQCLEEEVHGPSGDTNLHWAALLDAKDGTSTITGLLQSGASVSAKTTFECPISKDRTVIDTMPPHTTPMEWAIMADNVHALRTLKEWTDSRCNNDQSNLVYGVTPVMSHISYAAQYQSIECLRYLLKADKDHLRSFDARGFSSIYYAIRPNIFDRILRYRPNTKGQNINPDVAPFVTRQIEVVKLLLHSGSGIVLHKKDLFNCLHMTSAVGELEMLRYLLQLQSAEHMVNTVSVFGWTPLKDALMRGDPSLVDLLLVSGADPKFLWPGYEYHALHVCCQVQGPQSVEIAEKLLREDPSALMLQDHNASTPLHEASRYGHLRLIKLFLDRGAKLQAVNKEQLTPLGLAIRYRFVLAVSLLSSACRKQQLPLMAAKSNWFIPFPGGLIPLGVVPLGGRFVSALDFLLSPGRNSPSPDFKYDYDPLQVRKLHIGSYDVPFSDSSKKILKILVTAYEHRTRLGTNFLLNITHAAYRCDTGLHWAARMSNPKIIELMLADKNSLSELSSAELRDLIEVAFTQRLIGKSHISSEEDRKRSIETLQELQIEKHASEAEKRTPKTRFLLLTPIWRTYYLYGQLEQKQYERANTWLLEYRPSVEPRFLEFRPWYYARYSVYAILFVTLWLILTPLLVFFAVIASDPASEISTGNITYAVIMVLLVNGLAVWPKIFRVICVLFDAVSEKRPGEGWAMGWVQCALCVVFAGLASFNMWILEPSNAKLLRFIPQPGTYFADARAKWNGLDLDSSKRYDLSQFQGLCQVLMAWIVFVQFLPPVLLIWTRIMRQAERYGERSPKVNTEVNDYPQRDYIFGTRVFWFHPPLIFPSLN